MKVYLNLTLILVLSSSCAIRSESHRIWRNKYCNDMAITQEEECNREFKKHLKTMNPAPNPQSEEEVEYRQPRN